MRTTGKRCKAASGGRRSFMLHYQPAVRPSSPGRHGSRHGVVRRNADAPARNSKRCCSNTRTERRIQRVGPSQLLGQLSPKKLAQLAQLGRIRQPEDLVTFRVCGFTVNNLRSKSWYAREDSNL